MFYTQAQFDDAVATAREAIPVQKHVVKEDYWCGYAIVQDGKRLAVYEESAWEKPSTAGLLPWSAPRGDVVARVALDGTVTKS